MQETFDILRAEVEQLQLEVAERDAQLAEALATKREAEPTLDEATVTNLMERLEEMLDELDRSDERTGTLEELLRERSGYREALEGPSVDHGRTAMNAIIKADRTFEIRSENRLEKMRPLGVVSRSDWPRRSWL